MSNYRVRQVLALRGLSRRELRFLAALATCLDDEACVIRAGMDVLTEMAGLSPRMAKQARAELAAAGRIAYRPGRFRGDLTVWTVLCLPPKKGDTKGGPLPGIKGAPLGDPLPGIKGAPIGDPLPGEKRGSLNAEKGGHQKSADQQKREHELNPIDKPLPRAPARARAREDAPAPKTDDENDDDTDLTRFVIAEVRRHTGTTITPPQARRGLTEKMNHAGIRQPRSWLAKVIANDPAWWLPTPTPPRWHNGKFQED